MTPLNPNEIQDRDENMKAWQERHDTALRKAAAFPPGIEREAVAIFYSVHPGIGSDWARMDANGKEWFRWIARAAIAAMREPTEGMVRRGMQEVGAQYPEADARETWFAMIDEALKDPEQVG